MKKCIVISDSFKGTMSSLQICSLAKESIHKIFPECKVVAVPAADGGEGTVEAFLGALGGQKVAAVVTGPLHKPVEAFYGRCGDTAIIEMAAAAGLGLVGSNANPLLTTTYGVGELIYSAVKAGCQKIILGLGGSATNDGGCGMAAALGTVFTDKNGVSFVPVGATLAEISNIDNEATKQLLSGIDIEVMCDIDNPLYGEKGAAYVFAPQKGAVPAEVRLLDNNLRAFDEALQQYLGVSSQQSVKGAGAAGGMGAGAAVLLNGRLRQGIEIILDTVGIERELPDADAVFTGEGRLDSQSLGGKVVCGVAARAAKFNVPVYVLAGDVDDDCYSVYDKGVTAIFSINRLAIPYELAKQRSQADYQSTLEDVLRLLKSARLMQLQLDTI